MRARNVMTAVSAVLLLLIAQGYGRAGEKAPVINAVADPVKTTVGTPLVYTLKITFPLSSELKVALPEEKLYYPPDSPGAAENAAKRLPAHSVPLYGVQSADKKEETRGTDKTITVQVTLSYYRPGAHNLPELGIFDAEGIRVGYRVPSVTIDAVNPEGKFNEIEGPLALRGNYYRIMIIAGCLAVAAAAILLAVRRYRGKNNMRPDTASPRNPLQVFMEGMDELRRFAAEGRAAEYSEAVSLRFRRYLSARFGIEAMEMTAAEILRFLDGVMPPGGYMRQGRSPESLLRLWDLSKFAEFAPPPDALRANLDATAELARRLSREDTVVRH